MIFQQRTTRYGWQLISLPAQWNFVNLLTPAPVIICVLPIALYFACYFFYATNAPQFDDFQTIVRSSVTFNGPRDFIGWLIAQYGEHRIGYIRLVTITFLHVTGQIDLIWIGLIGNLSLVGMLIILFRWFKQNGLYRYFLPVPFILFQMNYHHNTFTAMMALQNLTILLWTLLTLWWVSVGQGWRLWAALLPAVLAVYTSGNGMFVVLVAILVLIYRRQWPVVGGWLVVGGGAVLGYFWGLDTIQPSYNLLFLATHTAQLSAFTLFFSGSYFDLLPNVLMSSVANSPAYARTLFYIRLLLPFIMGVLLMTTSFVLIGRMFLTKQSLKPGRMDKVTKWLTARFMYQREANVFPTAVLLFILLTACVVALGRIDIGIAQSFAVRYKVYSPLILICCYAALLVNSRHEVLRARFCRLLLPVSIAVCLNSYVQNLNQIHYNKRTALSGLHNIAVNKSWAVYGSYYGDIDSVMQAAISKGMYRVHPLATAGTFTSLARDLKKAWPVLDIVMDTTATAVQMRVSHSPLKPLPVGIGNDSYFIIYNDRYEYLFPAQPDRNGLGDYQSGFHCSVERTCPFLTPGLYRIAVMVDQRTHRQIYHTPHSVNLLAHR